MRRIVPLTMTSHCLAQGVGLHADGVFDAVAVASGHGDGDGNAAIAQCVEHAAVAFGQAHGAELEPPESIAFVRVGTGKVEDEPGRVVAMVNRKQTICFTHLRRWLYRPGARSRQDELREQIIRVIYERRGGVPSR